MDKFIKALMVTFFIFFGIIFMFLIAAINPYLLMFLVFFIIVFGYAYTWPNIN